MLYFLVPILVLLFLGVNGVKSKERLSTTVVVVLSIIFGFLSFFYTLKFKNALLLFGAGLVVNIIIGGIGYLLGIIFAIVVNIGAASEHNSCFN